MGKEVLEEFIKAQEELKKDQKVKFIDLYFKENYVEGGRYDVPKLSDRFEDMSEPWIEWLGAKQPDNIDTMEDPRVSLRMKEDYVWRVWLQREFEDIMNGTKSIFIFSGVKREEDKIEHKKNMDNLRDIFQKSIREYIESDEEYKIVVKESNRGYVKLVVEEMIQMFQGTNKDEGRWDFYESIANKCILLLFQESRAVIREIPHKDRLDDESNKKFDKKCNKCNKYFTTKGMKSHKRKKLCKKDKPPKWVEISMLERDFYIGLSEFIYRKMENNIELFKVKEEKYEGRKKPTLRRASRIFSVFVLSILMAEGEIWRRTGTYDDMLLHLEGEEEVVRKGKNMYPNMIHFSDDLRKKIGKCEVDDFENRGATRHASFRVLERNSKRWMNCQPEKHLCKEHESEKGKFSHEGGYLTSPPSSHLRTSILGKRKAGELRIRRAVASEDSLKALNILQETQWEINLDFLDHVANAKFDDGGVGSIKNKKQFIETINIRNEFHVPYYPESEGDVGRESFLRLHQIKKIIDNIGNTFWHSWALDWRGRVLCKSNLLSPQGSDIDRAFLRFKEWKAIGEEGWKWFRIFLFNFFEGRKDDRFNSEPDKELSFDERINWIDEHEVILRGFVGNWKNPKNKKLLDLDQRPKAKSETFQRISALIEYDRLVKEGESKDWSVVKSGHPIHFDASSNGLQHLSLLIDNEELAKEVNVIPEDNIKKDIYNKVCEVGKENWKNSELLKYLSDLGLKNEQLESVKELVFQRKMSKQPTMTVFYGATRLDKCFIGRGGKGKPKFQCIKCDKANCKHLFKTKYRLICWHEKSPLYESFEKDKELSGLIKNGGLLFAGEVSDDKKKSRQQIFAEYLVNDYREAIEKVTGGAVSKLQTYIGNRIDQKIVFPDDDDNDPWFKIAISYSSEKEAKDDLVNFEKEIKEKYPEEFTMNCKIETIVKYNYLMPKDREKGDYLTETGAPKEGEEIHNRLSWSLPDEFKVIYRYNEVKKDAVLQASSLHLHRLMEDVDKKDSFRHYLKVLDKSPKSKLSINNKYIKQAIEHVSNGDEEKVDLRQESLKNLKIKYLSDNKKNNDLKQILKEKGVRGFSNLKKGALAKLVVEHAEDTSAMDAKKKAELIDSCKEKGLTTSGTKAELIARLTEDFTDWDAIYSVCGKSRSTNNLIRAIYKYTVEEFLVEPNEFEKKWLIQSSVSIKINFPDFSDKLDIRQMKIAAAANFIHSMDGAHMRAVVREFDCRIKQDGGDSSIWSVHDAFGTHACDINKLLEIIKCEMINLHSKGNLSYWIPSGGLISSDLEDGCVDMDRESFRKRIKNKDIEISQYFVS